MHNGAQLYTVDPRRTSSAKWADGWLGLDVGTDIALSHTMAREIIHAGLVNHRFVDRATVGFAEYAAHVEPYTLAEGERITGVPADMIRETAHAFARADRAMICWTLGITEHHVGVDNVLSLINLALLCGHVGRWGSGLNPLRGQNNVQGGGDMGAIPNKLPGFQDIERDAEARARFEAAWGVPIVPRYGWNLTQMFEGMKRGELRTLYVIGENPAQSEADIKHTRELLAGLDFLVVQDILMTATAELADVVFPSSASWCESEGTVTNSERRVQRVRKALDPPGEARDDGWIIGAIAERMGLGWGQPTRRGGMGRAALALADAPRHELREARGAGRHPVAVPGRGEHRARRSCTRACGPSRSRASPRRSRRSSTSRPTRRSTPSTRSASRPAAGSSRTTRACRPIATARRCTAASRSTSRPRTPSGMLLEEGEIVRVSSRRGSVETPVHIDPSLRPGLTFMTFHFPDQVDTNLLTIDVTDPKSGTAEFKACAVRVDKLAAPRAAGRGARRRARDHSRRLMDIHLLDAAPTAAERAAVEHVLGAPAGRLGRRRARLRPAGPFAARRRARRALAPAPPAAGAAGGAGARRLDQPGRAQPHRGASHGAAGGRLRRGDVLRAAERRAAAAARRARVRGPGLPLQRLAGADRAARGAPRRRGRAQRRRLGHVAAQPLPRPVRPRARRHGDARGRRTRRSTCSRR